MTLTRSSTKAWRPTPVESRTPAAAAQMTANTTQVVRTGPSESCAACDIAARGAVARLTTRRGSVMAAGLLEIDILRWGNRASVGRFTQV